MKCIVLFAALCCLGVCAADGLSLDFLTANLLNPLLEQIQTNALSHLQTQLSNLFGNLFGKRALTDVLNINIGQVLIPFIAQIKEIYQRLFTIFLQIVQNAEAWIEKPDWARIEFVRAGADAEVAVSRMNLGAEFLQPLVTLVQQHLGTLITDFQAIIIQVLDATKHPLQSLIGAGNLLHP